MSVIILIFLNLIYQDAYSASWTKPYSLGGNQAVTPASTNCPSGYIGVPARPPYTFRFFCVAKYEMKLDAYGVPVSVPEGVPKTSVARVVARNYCQILGNGFDLISNDQWQTIARNIAKTASNWSNGIVASGELNRGHSDNSPANSLAAVADDNDPCNGTGESCTALTWNSQKRTHKLSNGNIIWDFAGNVGEWTTNNNTASNGTNDYISTMSTGDIRQIRYGADAGTMCATPSVAPYCGMGYGTVASNSGTVIRGGAWDLNDRIGIFTVLLNSTIGTANATIGFRCVNVP